MRSLLAGIALTLPTLASAQAMSCAVPAAIARPHADAPTAENPRRILPTASYTLAVTWVPEYCHGNADRESSQFECAAENHFGWKLHGLWPDGAGKDWPQYCRTVELLPEATIRSNMCSTPSAQLQQHEWAKHGSCMNIPAAAYFKQSTAMFARLHFPDMAALSERRGLTAGALTTLVARTNPGMAPGMIRVNANRAGWLEEVWFCHDLQFRLRQCRDDSGGVSASTPIKIAKPL